MEKQYFGRGPNQVFKASDGGGTMYLWWQGPVLITLVQGAASVELAKEILRVTEDILRRNDFIVPCHNFWDLTQNDPDARMLLSEWGKENKDKVKKILVLVKSSMVYMGVLAASIVYKNVVAFRDPDKFESAIHEILNEHP